MTAAAFGSVALSGFEASKSGGSTYDATMPAGTAPPRLLELAASGQVIGEINVVFGDGELTMTLKTVVVTGYQAAGEQETEDEVSLTAESVSYDYPGPSSS